MLSEEEIIEKLKKRINATLQQIVDAQEKIKELQAFKI